MDKNRATSICVTGERLKCKIGSGSGVSTTHVSTLLTINVYQRIKTNTLSINRYQHTHIVLEIAA